MSIYNIDHTFFAQDYVAPEFRDKETKAFIDSVIGLCGYNQQLVKYMVCGCALDLPLWSAGNWLINERCIYFTTGEVYECRVALTTEEPGTSTDWVKVLDTFIGTIDIKHFTGTRISLEYALSLRFFTVFSPVTATSHIYIETTPVSSPAFLVGAEEGYSSSIGIGGSDGSVPEDYTTTGQERFVIYYPAADYAVLGANAEKIVRNFVDQWVTAGTSYLIQTY